MPHLPFAKTALATAALLAATITMTAPSDAATRVCFQCSATGSVDISMKALYDIIGTGTTIRRKFTTEFEAGPGTGFVAGNRLAVTVKGVRVGVIILDAVVGGGALGDLNFDTRPQPPDSVQFPRNWPDPVGRGSVVTLFRGLKPVLGCTLR